MQLGKLELLNVSFLVRTIQFVELAAEKRFLFVNNNTSMCFTTNMCIDNKSTQFLLFICTNS